MASKSKKRRRVLGASCILAALIIAGSSFAWFTSKDEVTNRLSASGDYDVSIVESFAPPTKWLPGQEVNKDVYAVNTGDIDAFVKETVSSVLTITTEEAYSGDNNGKPVPGESIELSSAERYVKEAGSFLVYKPTGSEKELGVEIVSMTPGATENDYASAVTDFTPDVEGLYVFRRTIDVIPGSQGETFTYDAYYFVPGRDATPAYTEEGTQGQPGYKPAIDAQDAVPAKYYKVSNLKTTVADPTILAGDNVQNDGFVVSNPAPTYGFYKDETKTIVPELTYDAQNNRLVATYDTGKSLNALKDLAKAYEDASIAYQDALEELAAATRDSSGTGGANDQLATAKATLDQAISDLSAAKSSMDTAWTNYETAVEQSKTLKTEWENAAKNLQDALDALGSNGDSTDATAYGRLKIATDAEDAANAKVTNKLQARTDALSARNQAQTNVDNAADTARKAFLDDVIAKVNSDSDSSNNIDTSLSIGQQRDAAAAYISTLTYTQMTGLGIQNGDPGWAFYQLQLELKDKQDKLDAAETAYQAALLEQTTAHNATLAAQEDVNNREAEIGSAGDSTDGDTTNDDTLYALAEIAETAYVQKMEELYGATSGSNYGVNGKPEDGKYVEGDGSLYGKYVAASDAYDDANRDYAAALAEYNAKAGAAGNASNTVAAATNYVAQTEKAMNDAWAAYQAATTNPDAKKLKIYINLADVTTETGKENKWQLLPGSLEDKYVNTTTADGTDTIADTASFYYTGILGGGETTSKLIDSVVLDDQTTQDMYKYFDFDLNVTLDSAQVNIDKDGNYTAETAKAVLGKNATLSPTKDANAIVSWADDVAPTPTNMPAAATFTGTDGTNSYTITQLTPPKSIDYTDYTYELDNSGTKYYANSTDNGTTYYKYDTTTKKLLTGAGNEITLSQAATPIP